MSRRGANEGTIRKRADGRWEARVIVTGADGRRTRRSLLAHTRNEVRDKLTAAQRAEANGLPQPAERVTVGAFLDGWLRDSVRPTVRPSTYRNYEAIVRVHLAPGLGHVPLARLTPQQVQAFLNAKSTGKLAPRTVAYLRAVLRQALGQAERWGLVTRNAARLAEPPRVPRREVSPLSPDQARLFIEAIRGDRLEALYLVALGAGLRQGEILGLAWTDIDFEAATLTVRHALQRVDGQLTLGEPKSVTSRRVVALPNSSGRCLACPSDPPAPGSPPGWFSMARRSARLRLHHDGRDAHGRHRGHPAVPGDPCQRRTTASAIP